MPPLKSFLDVVLIGAGLAAVFYWVAFLFRRVTHEKVFFGWWCKVVLLQGIIIAAALKVLKFI